MKNKVLVVLTIVSALLLQGCVAFALGTGAAVTAKAVSDPRTVGNQVDDTTLDSRVGIAIENNRAALTGSRIVATAYHGAVLLTGQATSKAQIQRVNTIVLNTAGVQKVYNQIRVGPKIGAGTLANDTWITTKVKSQLIANSQTKARNIKIVTENSEVFLLGMVTRSEAQRVTETAGKVAGVKLVVTAFKLTD